ncbi:peroxynitrite isomerase THAP4-like [Centropristis striata]|uniref:peroxynitrite isomerase THAP4-like n=1 Tax=Centropristis striata TaxID=184440 RepID=UPI0027DEB9F4|nr:peroxynitrite isomerase THAP4-like [Centropristis striata]
MSCSAFGCYKRQSKDSGVSFFRFPFRDHDRLSRWSINVRRLNWTPTTSSRLCSMHFEEDQFFTDNAGKRRLKDNAIPTIFDFPPHLMIKKSLPRTTGNKRWAEDSSVPTSVPSSVPSVPSPSTPVQPQGTDGPDLHLCSVLAIKVEIPDPELESPVVPEEEIPANPYSLTRATDHRYALAMKEPSETSAADSDLQAGTNEANMHVDDNEVTSDDETEGSTSTDPKLLMRDHDYFTKKQPMSPGTASRIAEMETQQINTTLRLQVSSLQAKLVAARKKIKMKSQLARRMQVRLKSLKTLTRALQKKLDQNEKQLKRLLGDVDFTPPRNKRPDKSLPAGASPSKKNKSNTNQTELPTVSWAFINWQEPL